MNHMNIHALTQSPWLPVEELDSNPCLSDAVSVLSIKQQYNLGDLPKVFQLVSGPGQPVPYWTLVLSPVFYQVLGKRGHTGMIMSRLHLELALLRNV